MTAFSFNASSVEPDQGRIGPVPAGWYKVAGEKAEMKPTKDTTGNFISLQCGILEGPYKGQKIFNNFNIKNNSEKAVEIGYKQLSAQNHAIGLMQMQDLNQMCNIPFFVKVKVDDSNTGYDPQNVITAFRHISDAAAIAAYSVQGSTPQAAVAKAAVIPPAAQPAAGWTPPIVAVAAAPAVQAAPVPQWQQLQSSPAVQAAPVPQVAAQTPAPAWTPPGNAQPWQNQAPPVQAAAPVTTAPVQQATTVPSQESASAPSDELPPWMQAPSA